MMYCGLCVQSSINCCEPGFYEEPSKAVRLAHIIADCLSEGPNILCGIRICGFMENTA